MQDCHGYWRAAEDGESGIIAVADDLTRQELIDTFLEEWAHARTAHLEIEGEDDDDPYHHATFWSELGRITKRFRDEW